MSGDNRPVCLFGHNEPEKILTYLEVRVWLQFGGGVFCSGRARVVSNYRLSLGTLHRHSSERGERRTKRKKYFGFFSHRIAPNLNFSINIDPYNLRGHQVHRSIVEFHCF